MAIDWAPWEKANQLKGLTVDLHAEAASEWEMSGWNLDGSASVTADTHAPVPTAVARTLPNGSAYLSHLGMAALLNFIIDSEAEDIFARFPKQISRRLRVPHSGQLRSNCANVDDANGQTREFRRADGELA